MADRASEFATAGVMPVGSPLTQIRREDVTFTEGNKAPAVYTDDATATLVWDNYNEARNYIENNAWLLEWQETDILYQDPTPDRFQRVQPGRPARLSQFLVAKFTRTEARAVKRALFAEQAPFFLRPVGKETEEQIDAWSAVIAALLKRMKFTYHGGLQINTQTLQGTGVGKVFWDEQTYTKKTRKRKNPPPVAELPAGGQQEIPTRETDEFEEVEKEVTESWPRYEYRRLGTSLFDPKWCTPDQPDESAGYVIDVDYVYLSDLQQMRQMDCYKNIPSEETLIRYFFYRASGSAPVGSSMEDSSTAQGSMVTHAEGRNRQTNKTPAAIPLMLIEQRDIEGGTKTILCYDGQKLTIRNDNDGYRSLLHPTCTWWPIDNSGYGMGIGRISGWAQRLKKGVLNEAVKMVAYPMNAPILVRRGENAPTQNVVNRHGGFWQVDCMPNEDVNKAVGFMKMPDVPNDAWKMIQLAQEDGEALTGANSALQQGNAPGPGSSVTRTAAGVNRVAGQSDQSVADPVDSFADGVIVPVVEYLIHCVKTKMPLEELRSMLSVKHAAVIEKAIDEEQFLNCEFEVTVLAGQKLAAKAGIQQLIPLFLQIIQQPQLLQFLHEKGETIDFATIMDLMMQVSELMEQPDIFVQLTPEQKQTMQQMQPGPQKVAGALAVEQQKGANTTAAIHTKGDVDLANKAAEIAMQHEADMKAQKTELDLAEGRVERGADEAEIRGGLPDQLAQ